MAHGLGHLIAPYHEGEAPAAVPAPSLPLAAIGVERWQHDVWHRILTAALAGHPAQVETRDLPGFNRPAVSRYAATTPRPLTWFKTFNRKKPYYRQQVRPFGFLLAFQASHAASGGASDRPLTAQPPVADQPPPPAKPAKPSLPKVVAPL